MHQPPILNDERGYRHLARQAPDETFLSRQTITAIGFASIYALYLASKYLLGIDLPFLEIAWNALVWIVPLPVLRLLSTLTTAKDDQPDWEAARSSSSEMRALKSQTLRQMLRLDSVSYARAESQHSVKLSQRFSKANFASKTPAGLGNWDNSCYQNSVLQGLTSLETFTSFLNNSSLPSDVSTTIGSLKGLTEDLMSPKNNGRRIWTPAKLKSMSSWQQQDAQEYFSRVLDDIEKETKDHLIRRSDNKGLEQIANVVNTNRANREDQLALYRSVTSNPLEGLLGQRVACVTCGYSEGISLLPFNCLTVSLGSEYQYSLENLFDEYTKMEEIEGVECLSCTFKRQAERLRALADKSNEDKDTEDEESRSLLSLPPELRQQVFLRLENIKKAIDTADFSESSCRTCAITKDARVSSTKTKQVVVARPPKSLVVHINRSIFDENTGALRKNPARVHYPKTLSLRPWTLGRTSHEPEDGEQTWTMDPRRSMAAQSIVTVNDVMPGYVLRAVVTHYGRHENGHYICYREHPDHTGENSKTNKDSENNGPDTGVRHGWWRLSDDDVTPATEAEVLQQSGAFMLFYEQQNRDDMHAVSEPSPPTDLMLAPSTEMQETSAAVSDGNSQATLVKSGMDRREMLDAQVHPAIMPETPVVSSLNTEGQDTDDVSHAATGRSLSTRSPARNSPTVLRTARGKSRTSSGHLNSPLPTVTAQ